jgi:hypothetical protein
MIAKCPKCSLTAEITITGHDRYSTTPPSGFAGVCPVLAEKLKEKGRLEASEIECPHLSQAAGEVFREWRERHRL